MDQYLESLLQISGVVLVQGPRWCGKTTTAKKISRSSLMLGDTGVLNNSRGIADIDPSRLLDGETPRLIDEWQVLPSLWDSIRTEVDNRGSSGQFILMGSTTTEAPTLHSGAGRIIRVMMRAMSLFESGESNGSVSLGGLFEGEEVSGHCDITLDQMASTIVRGGWPSTIGMIERDSARLIRGYIDAIAESELRIMDGIRRDPDNVRKIIQSVSRNICTTATISTIRKDVEKHQSVLSDKTVSSYISALRRVFVVENLPAWSAELRSKAIIRTTPKRYLSDPSIAAASLGASTSRILSDMSTFGLLFECLCIRDLRIYAQVLDAKVSFYQDNNGLEVDAIIESWDGRWGAMEIKLGQAGIEEGVRNLLRLREVVAHPPEFMVVLTLNGYAYRRQDGVFVIPVGCLRD